LLLHVALHENVAARIDWQEHVVAGGDQQT